MKKGLLLAVCAIAALALNVWAQARRHDEIMKEVSATYEKLKTGLDAMNAAQAAQDAQKLQNLFKEVEQFWTAFDTKDAMEAAKSVQTTFGALSESVKVNNFQQALTTYNAAARYCAACHGTHRVQMADKSYRIKP